MPDITTENLLALHRHLGDRRCLGGGIQGRGVHEFLVDELEVGIRAANGLDIEQFMGIGWPILERQLDEELTFSLPHRPKHRSRSHRRKR